MEFCGVCLTWLDCNNYKQNKTKNDEGGARIKRQLTRPVSLIATQPSRALMPPISTNGGLLLLVMKRSLSFLGTGAVK